MWRMALLMTGSLLLAGCQNSYRPVTAPFHDTEFQPFTAAGQTTLTGHAIRAKQGAPAALCKSVMLMPKTPFTADFVESRRHGPGYSILNPPTTKPYYFPKAVREVKCDAEGGFVFKDLPAGAWFILPEMPKDEDELLSETTTDGVKPSTANLTEHDLLRTAW